MAQFKDALIINDAKVLGNVYASKLESSVGTSTHLAGNQGRVLLNSTAAAGYNMLARVKSTNGVYTFGGYNTDFKLHYTADSVISAGTNTVTYAATLLNESGNATFPNNLYIHGGTRVPRITKGTGDPSGGSDGDVYIKYTA